MKKTFADKEKLSLQDYTKLMTDVANANIAYRNGHLRIEKLEKMRDYVTEAFIRTNLNGQSPVEIAVAGLCNSMQQSSKTMRNYIIPLEMTKYILNYIIYTKGYCEERDFRLAPLHNMGASMDSLYFAIIGKIDSNIKNNRNMPSEEFLMKFGGVEQDEVVHYYNKFAEEAFGSINHWIEKEHIKKDNKLEETVKTEEKIDNVESIPEWLLNI